MFAHEMKRSESPLSSSSEFMGSVEDGLAVKTVFVSNRERTSTEATVLECDNTSNCSELGSEPEHDVFDLLSQLARHETKTVTSSERIDIERQLELFPDARDLVISIRVLQSKNAALKEENNAQALEIDSAMELLRSESKKTHRLKKKYNSLFGKYKLAAARIQRQKSESSKVQEEVSRWMDITKEEMRRHAEVLTTWFKLQLHELGIKKDRPDRIEVELSPSQEHPSLSTPTIRFEAGHVGPGLCSLAERRAGETVAVTVGSSDVIDFCTIPIQQGIQLEEEFSQKPMYRFGLGSNKEKPNAFLVARTDLNVAIGHRLVAIEEASSNKVLEIDECWTIAQLEKVVRKGKYTLFFSHDSLTVGEKFLLDQAIKALGPATKEPIVQPEPSEAEKDETESSSSSDSTTEKSNGLSFWKSGTQGGSAVNGLTKLWRKPTSDENDTLL